MPNKLYYLCTTSDIFAALLLNTEQMIATEQMPFVNQCCFTLTLQCKESCLWIGSLSSAEYWWTAISLILLTTLFVPNQDATGFLATWAHCLFIFSQLSTNMLESFWPMWLLPATLLQVCSDAWDYCYWNAGLGTWSFWSHTIGFSSSSHLCGLFQLSGRLTLPPILMSSANLLWVHSSRLSVKILNKAGSSTDCFGTSLMAGHQLDLAPFTKYGSKYPQWEPAIIQTSPKLTSFTHVILLRRKGDISINRMTVLQ